MFKTICALLRKKPETVIFPDFPVKKKPTIKKTVKKPVLVKKQIVTKKTVKKPVLKNK
jgi:hypothetical protein